MALQTSADSPAPLRQISTLIGAVRRPARRGVGRGRGRLAQPPSGQVLPGAARPPGHAVDPGHLPREHPRRRRRPRSRRAPASSSTPSPRSTSRTASSRSRSARSGRPARASCWPSSSDASSCWPPRACSTRGIKKPLPLLPRAIGLITGRDSDAEKDVLQNAPPALAGGAVRGAARAHAGRRLRRAPSSSRSASSRPAATSTSSWSPAAVARSRTCCRSPTRR